MRAIVDQDRCEGHARCFAVAPELFDVDDDGYNVVDEIDVATAHEEQASDAASACPLQAIRLVG